MWYFIVTILFFVLSLCYRVFDDTKTLVFGMFPMWIAYLWILMILYAIASLIFGLKTWRSPEDEE